VTQILEIFNIFHHETDLYDFQQNATLFSTSANIYERKSGGVATEDLTSRNNAATDFYDSNQRSYDNQSLLPYTCYPPNFYHPHNANTSISPSPSQAPSPYFDYSSHAACRNQN